MAEDKSCNNCLYHKLSIAYEQSPDDGAIQQCICSRCGKCHKFYAEPMPHREILRLAEFLDKHTPEFLDGVRDGGAVDNAIRLISSAYYLPYARKGKKRR